MDESSLSSDISGIEVSALKEALYAQHDVMEKLQLELEMERESAGTAVSEAMSMILRLQGEKAAEEMEARQYKRVTEEKLYHAEKSMNFYEELMHWKEMQISSLERQLQACQHKLFSVGYYDVENGEMNLFGGSSFCMNGPPLNDFDLTRIGRRASLPLMRLEHSKSEIDSGEKESFIHLYREHNTEIEAHCKNGFKSTKDMLTVTEGGDIGDNNISWQKIEQTDQRMESQDKICKGTCNWEPSGKGLNATSAAYSRSSKSKYKSSLLLKPDADRTSACSSYQVRGSEDSSLDSDAHSSPLVEHTTASMIIHDVYEIPQDQMEVTQNFLFDGKKASQDSGEMSQHAAMSRYTDEDHSIENVVQNAENEDEESSKWQFASTSFTTNHVDPKVGCPLCQSDYLKIDQRLRLLEDERTNMERQESEGRKKEIQLLSKISDQLRSIQMQNGSLKRDRQSMPVEYMDHVIEVMLSVSI